MDKNEILIKTTIRDIISGFSHTIEERTGRPFIDFRWPNRLIYFHLINQRAKLYYETRKQNQLEGNYEDYAEVIPCVSMKEIDKVECPCAPASGCTFMKSILPLPTFVGGQPIVVSTLDGDRKYDFVEWSMFKHKINNRISGLNSSMLYTTRTIDNERWLYTYITKNEKVHSVMVSGVPVDPMEIMLYPVCGVVKVDMCNILDLQFIIEKRLINDLYNMTFEKLVAYNNATQVGDTKSDDRNAQAAPDERF